MRQPFFIGDGLTSGSVVQQFIAPTGATRLFVGMMDRAGWWNNQGSFSVTATVVPEPATLSVLGVAILGSMLRRRR
jgi:hypothetical protein